MKIDIKRESGVAKIRLTNNSKAFLYCEIYGDKFGVDLFTGKGFDRINGPWKKIRFNTKDFPITDKGLFELVLEYRREILVGMMEYE